jgi:hypothetical protein
MGRPAKICQLSKGKLLDTHRGFVATWRWLCAVANALYSSRDLKVVESGDDIVITVNSEVTARYV